MNEDNIRWDEVAATADKWHTLRKKDLLTLLYRAADEIYSLRADMKQERVAHNECHDNSMEALSRVTAERDAEKRNAIELQTELDETTARFAKVVAEHGVERMQRNALDREVAELNHELANRKPFGFWRQVFGVKA